MKKLMKTLPSALTLGIVLSAGGVASAQMVEISGRGIPTAGAGSMAAVHAAPMSLSPAALAPSIAAPSAFAPALAAPAASASAALPALAALPAASAPAAAAPDATAVSEYRRLHGEYREANRSVNDFYHSAAFGGSVPHDAFKSVQERDARKAELDAFVAAHPGVRYAAAGALGRAWLAMTGRAFDGSAANNDADEPTPVSEYRRLHGEYKASNSRLRGLYFTASLGEPLPPSYQTLQDVHKTLQKSAAQKAELDAFVAAHPGVRYAAAGTLGRAWLALTGRAP